MTESEKLTPEQIAAETSGEAPVRLNLEVKVATKSACERHVTVTVSEEDIKRYFSKQFDELMPRASVPGFRPGRAPRRLVESRFRDQVADQVKGAILLDSMTQVNDEQTFSAISEPDFDFEAIKVPDSGPLTYEFDIEVRPEFDMPNWKGLELETYKVEIPDSEIDKSLRGLMADQGTMVPVDGPAVAGDSITAAIEVSIDGQVVSSSPEITVTLADTVSFPEGTIEGFAAKMAGVKAGDERSVDVELADTLDDEKYAGKSASIKFTVLDVKRVELPAIDDEVLGKFNLGSEQELRDAIRRSLSRRVEYASNQRTRDRISSLLTESAKWELPPGLLKRQFRRELERSVLELRSAGFDESTIRGYENALKQNTLSKTRTLLQEHFILERIAEEEKIEDVAADYDMEIALIAAQQNDSPRRVRARLERRGQMDALRNQIIERKVLDLIKSHATVKEVPYEFPGSTDGVDFSLIGAAEESDIPSARYGDTTPAAGTNNPST